MTVLTVLRAFLAGIVPFASPCCLPLVPAYLATPRANTSDIDACTPP